MVTQAVPKTPVPPAPLARAEQISPFRYPGGKTWLVPQVLGWIRAMRDPVGTFVEPFAGGGIVSLNVAACGLADRVVMSEIDPDVGSVWSVLIDGEDAEFATLAEEILGFVMEREAVVARLAGDSTTRVDRAFRTILRNRVNRGGIMARRGGLLNAGERNRGLSSRWYPETLVRRMTRIRGMRDRIRFVQGDAFDVLDEHARDPSSAFFIDPPYTAGGGRVGARLYTHSEIDHPRLFAAVAALSGPAIMTYDDLPEVRELARANGLSVAGIRMMSTHHKQKLEVAIGRGDVWGPGDAGVSLQAA